VVLLICSIVVSHRPYMQISTFRPPPHSKRHRA
jgi:hypothetical protein